MNRTILWITAVLTVVVASAGGYFYVTRSQVVTVAVPAAAASTSLGAATPTRPQPNHGDFQKRFEPKPPPPNGGKFN